MYSRVTLNAKMSSFGVDTCTETFVTHSSSSLRRWTEAETDEGLAWHGTVSSMMQCISGTNVSGRVFMSKEGILSIMIQEHEDANV